MFKKTKENGVLFQLDLIDINVNRQNKKISMSFKYSFVNDKGIPQEQMKGFVVSNKNEWMIDPMWNANSIPPKPPGFNYASKDTYGPFLNPDGTVNQELIEKIPRIMNPDKQYYDLIFFKKYAGATLHDEFMNGIFYVMTGMNAFPDGGPEGWELS